MRRGSEQLNPTHSFQITDDFAAFFCISINISFPWKHWFTKEFLTEKLVLNLIPVPALLWKFSSSVYFFKLRRSKLCCVHDVDRPWIYIVNFSSCNIYREVFISFGFPICLKKSCV